jgi:3-deoxy-D-arabino-heptulosonate 7-phosphate (DAHP) synthase
MIDALSYLPIIADPDHKTGLTATVIPMIARAIGRLRPRHVETAAGR